MISCLDKQQWLIISCGFSWCKTNKKKSEMYGSEWTKGGSLSGSTGLLALKLSVLLCGMFQRNHSSDSNAPWWLQLHADGFHVVETLIWIERSLVCGYEVVFSSTVCFSGKLKKKWIEILVGWTFGVLFFIFLCGTFCDFCLTVFAVFMCFIVADGGFTLCGFSLKLPKPLKLLLPG